MVMHYFITLIADRLADAIRDLLLKKGVLTKVTPWTFTQVK